MLARPVNRRVSHSLHCMFNNKCRHVFQQRSASKQKRFPQVGDGFPRGGGKGAVHRSAAVCSRLGQTCLCWSQFVPVLAAAATATQGSRMAARHRPLPGSDELASLPRAELSSCSAQNLAVALLHCCGLFGPHCSIIHRPPRENGSLSEALGGKNEWLVTGSVREPREDNPRGPLRFLACCMYVQHATGGVWQGCRGAASSPPMQSPSCLLPPGSIGREYVVL